MLFLTRRSAVVSSKKMTCKQRPERGKQASKPHGPLRKVGFEQKKWQVQRPWGGSLSGKEGSSRRCERGRGSGRTPAVTLIEIGGRWGFEQ